MSISEINLTYKVPPNLTMNCDKMKKNLILFQAN